METPIYKHNCNTCQFLGHFEGRDLYACVPFGTIATVISRFGDRPSEFSSGLGFAVGLKRGKLVPPVDWHLAEALSRALDLGLTYDEKEGEPCRI